MMVLANLLILLFTPRTNIPWGYPPINKTQHIMIASRYGCDPRSTQSLGVLDALCQFSVRRKLLSAGYCG